MYSYLPSSTCVNKPYLLPKHICFSPIQRWHNHDPVHCVPFKALETADVLYFAYFYLRTNYQIIKSSMTHYQSQQLNYQNNVRNLFKVNHKDKRTTSLTLLWCLYYQFWTKFSHFSSASTVEQVNAGWAHRNHSFDSHSKSIDWFPWNRNIAL